MSAVFSEDIPQNSFPPNLENLRRNPASAAPTAGLSNAQSHGGRDSGFGIGISHVIQPPIFRTDEEIRNPVIVEIDGRGTGVVSFDIAFADVVAILKSIDPVLFPDLSEEVGILVVDQEVEFPVAVPIKAGQLSASAPATCSWIELQGLPVYVAEDPPRGREFPFPIGILPAF